MKTVFSAVSRNVVPDNKATQILMNMVEKMLPLIAIQLTSGGNTQISNEIDEIFVNNFGSLLSAITKMIENGEIQSAGVAVPVLDFFSNVLSFASKNTDPKDDVAQTFSNGARAVLSIIGREINSGRGGQIQSDNELPVNLLGTLVSTLQKKAIPKDEVGQPFLSLFNTLISGAKSRIEGGVGRVPVDTLTAYTAKRFDQCMTMDSVNENAAMVETEGDMVEDLTDKAKAQLWGAILHDLASDIKFTE